MKCNSVNPCNPVLYLQTTSVLLYRIFLSDLVVYLLAFGNITWKLGKRDFHISAEHCPILQVVLFVHHGYELTTTLMGVKSLRRRAMLFLEILGCAVAV